MSKQCLFHYFPEIRPLLIIHCMKTGKDMRHVYLLVLLYIIVVILWYLFVYCSPLEREKKSWGGVEVGDGEMVQRGGGQCGRDEESERE